MNGKKETFHFQDNAFDLIRCWAAICVMFLHYTGYALRLSAVGTSFMRILRWVVSFFPGVVVLFAMSGFLISASYERSKDKKEFFIKRVLRMYPELWVCTIVNLIVVCVLAYELLDKSIIVWIVTQIFGIANTPSCLNSFATGSINGALWTIFTEMQLYIVLGLGYDWLKKLTTKKWLVFLVFLSACNIGADYVATTVGGGIAKIIERLFLTYALWFFIGVFCYIKREQLIPALKKIIPVLLIVYVFCKCLPIDIPGYYADISVGILLPFIVIAGGYFLPKIRISCDLSYEIFLYHWIVLNVIVHFDLMNKWPWYIVLVIFVCLTLALSWLSWRFVGQGRRKLKRKLTQ